MCARGTCQPCEHATTASWIDCQRQFRAVWVPSTSTTDCPSLRGTGQARHTCVHVFILNEKAKKDDLVDVTVPWGSEDNLKASRERKVEKYSGAKNCLEQKGFEVLLEGFLVGSLGT